MAQKRGQRKAPFDDATGHRRRLDDVRPHGRRYLPPDTHEPRRREYDEADEQQAKEQQPVRGVDRQVFAEQGVEEHAQRGAEQASHAADDDHREKLAGERDGNGVCGCEPVMECEQRAGHAGECRRQHERDLLVAIRRVPDELGALLVLANREQYGADR